MPKYFIMKLSFTQKFLSGIVILFVSILITSCSSSRKSITIEEGWDLIGERKVNFVRDRDEFMIYNNNGYTAIRFRVEKRDIKINGLQIVYQNGDVLSPVIDDVITKGEYSRIIELGVEPKNIRSINFKYRTTGSVLKGRANVLIFGRRYVSPYKY